LSIKIVLHRAYDRISWKIISYCLDELIWVMGRTPCFGQTVGWTVTLLLNTKIDFIWNLNKDATNLIWFKNLKLW